MGWKGTLRSWEAAARRAERESQRRYRELEKQRKQQAKMLEMERAAYEVEVYENLIDRLLSIHKECTDAVDWKSILERNPPQKHLETHIHEEKAQARFDNYVPGFFTKLFNLTESRKARLLKFVIDAKAKDLEINENDFRKYESSLVEWKELNLFAKRILDGENAAYLEAIDQFNVFNEISDLGSSIDFRANVPAIGEVTVTVNSEEVIPNEIKSLSKSGKLLVKKMPIIKFYETYQDYICGCVLRIARELFAILPIEVVIVTAFGRLLNTQTGLMEDKPILSVAMPRDTIDSLNFEMLDPSDSMKNFLHKMNFKKATGFNPVDHIEAKDIKPL